MMLEALCRYYDRLVTEGAPDVPGVFGFSQERISFAVVLTPEGRIAQVEDLRQTSGKRRGPRHLSVPQIQRTAGIKPAFLWDNTGYVLGTGLKSSSLDAKFCAFRQWHEQVLRETTDPGLLALFAFIRSWSPEHFDTWFPKEALDTNLVFRLEGDSDFLHERRAARALWQRLLDEQRDKNTRQGVCMVSGEPEWLARIHPKVKGVPGTAASGASLVSYNDPAFLSYRGTSKSTDRHDTAANAPIAERVAFAYTAALNYLLRDAPDNRQRLALGDLTLVFWAEADNPAEARAAEDLLCALLSRRTDDEAASARVQALLKAVATGDSLNTALEGLNPSVRVYLLGLSPSMARIAVRLWHSDTLARCVQRMVEHWQDLALEFTPWASAPTLRGLALATAPHHPGKKPKMTDAATLVVGETLRAILTGTRYPRSLLTTILMRLRSDGQFSSMRVALCKGVLARERRLRSSTRAEPVPGRFDPACHRTDYQLGRLLAVLERAQYFANGGTTRASLREHYYSRATAAPALVFPLLLQQFQKHLNRIRERRKYALANGIDSDAGTIVTLLTEAFPRHLSIEEQTFFVLGYYHQTRFHFARTRAAQEKQKEQEAQAATPWPDDDPNAERLAEILEQSLEVETEGAEA